MYNPLQKSMALDASGVILIAHSTGGLKICMFLWVSDSADR
jgi:hypothetical protein